jgi:hypothetical protein
LEPAHPRVVTENMNPQIRKSGDGWTGGYVALDHTMDGNPVLSSGYKLKTRLFIMTVAGERLGRWVRR